MMGILDLQDLTLKLKNKQWILVLLFTFFIQALVVFEAMAADTTIKGTTSGITTVAALEVTNLDNTSLLYVCNDGNVGIGTTSPTTDANPNGDTTGNFDVNDVWLRGANAGAGGWASAGGGGGIGIMPIGSIIAWHKDITGAATLAEANAAGFAVCDGTDTSEVPGAVIATTPNLNADARFLRGSSTSGTEQAATSHFHFGSYGNRLYFPKAMTEVLNTESRTTDVSTVLTAVLDTSTDLFYKLYKARPVNMSVVWIMRVK